MQEVKQGCPASLNTAAPKGSGSEASEPVLFVKLDGIGDYLFFRLFWPQISQFARQEKKEISFLCSEEFLPLVEKYDKKYIHKFFTLADIKKWRHSRIFFFLPRYYKRFLRGIFAHLLWEKQWQTAYNMQPLRDTLEEDVMKRIRGKEKVSNQDVNLRTAPRSFYQDSTYTQLLSVPQTQFVVPFFRELLEKSLGYPFALPSLQLPFSNEDIQAAVRRKKLGERYIVFVPFTSAPFKNWPVERFVFLAKKLAEITSLKVVVLGRCWQKQSNAWADCPNVINLVNRTSLIEGMQLAAGASYAVCSDTSLMHCALLGRAHTISLSCGQTKDLFAIYPAETNVKQKVFLPVQCDNQGIGRIEDIDAESVWQYIKSSWFPS